MCLFTLSVSALGLFIAGDIESFNDENVKNRMLFASYILHHELLQSQAEASNLCLPKFYLTNLFIKIL